MEYVKAFALSLLSALIIVLAAIGSIFLLTSVAQASTWNEKICGYVARDAGILHGAKTKGMTWDEAEPQIMMALDAAIHNPDSYVKDGRDVQRSYEVAQFVWAHNLPIEPTVQIVLARCLKEWAGPEI